MTNTMIIKQSITINDQFTQVDEYYIHLLHTLNSTQFTKELALKGFYSLIRWNLCSEYLTHFQLQKLWMKLIKKYKFKYREWNNISNSINIHSFLIDDSGDGLQSLIRFYHERKLTLWEESAFSHGIYQLIYEKKMQRLEMYFLTSVICYEWKKCYITDIQFGEYFNNTKQIKVRELYFVYNAYIYQHNLVTAIKLHQLLSHYNPQFKTESKNTPLFYKDLDCFVNGI